MLRFGQAPGSGDIAAAGASNFGIVERWSALADLTVWQAQSHPLRETEFGCALDHSVRDPKAGLLP